MIKLVRITDPNDLILGKLLPIYKEAFPACERRDEKQLKYLIGSNTSMYFNAILLGDELAGLFAYWDMGDFYFLEHLAVAANMRNHKIGQQVLDWVAENLNGLRLLEVEPIEGEISARRIRYYERNGYKILDKSYRQPSYSEPGKSYPLWIMGNEDNPNLQSYIDEIKNKAYINNYIE